MRPSAIRAGARRPSGASASSAGARRSRSTATPTRSPRSTRGWTSASTTEPVTRRGRIVLKLPLSAACPAPPGPPARRAATDQLGANPISFVTNTLGDWTLRILLASLAMTPLGIVLGAAWPVTLRRLLGLFAFAYACLHFSVWIVLDFFFDWARMGEDIVKRPYITLGMAALLTLVPLAVTSTSGMVRRLGGRAWRRLHRLAYAAGVLAALHFIWLAKVGRTDQYWHAAALGLLLGVRLAVWTARAVRRRAAAAAAVTPSAAPRPCGGKRPPAPGGADGAA